MTGPTTPDPTISVPPLADPLDAGLAEAFGQDSGPPLPVGDSMLKALGITTPEAPHVHLRDSEGPPDAPVAEVPGRLQLLGEIARGGMGAVHRGRDADLGREVAVKVLLEAHAGRTELVQRFVEEAQVAGQLQHPNVVPVYELGQLADQRPYFTMKLVKGRTLAAQLRERKDPTQDRPRLLSIFQAVCQAVAYAHARGVIHRDLKPLNVMVGNFGEVQVMDWGLAKVLSQGEMADATQPPEEISVIRTARGGSESAGKSGSQTQVGSVLGTPAYMPPEQARGEVDRLDERADVFGLGGILCEILTGKPPYTGATSREIFDKAGRADLADATARLDTAEADAELLRLARVCLAPDPADRPRHAGEVADAMTAYLDGVAERLRTAEVERAAAQARAEGERKRRQLAVALAASVLLLVLGGGGALLWVQQERANRIADQARHEAEQARRAAEIESGATEAYNEAVRRRQKGDNAAARAVLRRAEGLLASDEGHDDLRQRVKELAADLDMLASIDEARIHEAGEGAGRAGFDLARAAPVYRKAFQEYRIDVLGLDTDEAARRIARRSIRKDLVAALDDWAIATRDKEERQRVLKVAAAADPDPHGFSSRFRAVLESRDQAELRALAAEVKPEQLGPTELSNLGLALWHRKEPAAAVALLRAAQRLHPTDFWISHNLAICLEGDRRSAKDEELRLFSIAVAQRSDSPTVWLNLGVALLETDRIPEAADAFRKAISLRPDYALAHSNLAETLRRLGKLDETRLAHRLLECLAAPAGAPVGVPMGSLLRTVGAVGAGGCDAFGLWEEALVHCQKAQELEPNLITAHDVHGALLSDLGKLSEAEQAHLKAIELDPAGRFSVPRKNLGLLYHDQGKLDQAAAAFREAFRIGNDPRVLGELGLVLFDQGKIDEATDALRKVIAMQPDLAAAWSNLCMCQSEQGQLADAEQSGRKAIALDPKLANGHSNLGNVLMQQGKLSEAIAACRKALELDPHSPEAHTVLGACLAQQGKPHEGMEHLQAALRRKPESHHAWTDYGFALDRLGKLEEGLAAHRKAVELAPRFETGWYNLGVALRERGKYEEAADAFRRAIALRESDHHAHQNLGSVLEKVDRPDEALKHYRRAIEIQPQDAKSHGFLGTLLIRRKDLPEAAKHLQIATRLQPTLIETHNNLGYVLGLLGRLPEAEAAYRKALQIQPDNPAVLHNLGNVLLAMGRAAEAINAYRAALAGDPKEPRYSLSLGRALLDEGVYAEALIALRHTRQIIPPDDARRGTVEMLLRRANIEAALEKKLPAILRKEAEPENAIERIGLAHVCRAKKLYGTAARFYEEAFQTDKTLADKNPGQRYHAACYAALAGLGLGGDAALVTDKERTRWREQAVAWLRADLERLARRLERAGTERERGAIRNELQSWLQNRDLAGLRHPEALKRLPAEEREACKKIWADVQDLLQKAAPTK